MPRMGFGGGFGLLEIGWIIMVILVWVLIIAAIVLGIRWLIRSDHANRTGGPQGGPPTAPPPAAPPRPDDPLEILRARYARGEIDDEEYERRRRILTG